ncbi:hypothetical protein DFH05DRAFT_1399235 [Lentinula detonsa]|uniref:Uncharacterized protein n=1 Tax=Lentinula detonsa TaxID=2804962 RepID=A0A9W8P0V8_9AGAR|nr:hypothetical protein DFH05DRAFT_1399235 [Lentinula detonsa]
MTTPVPLLPLAERIDIHKSCKSFETLLSVFNDYCEAAGAVVTLQKKMVKALRETAGMKVIGEIPASALNATATIFEALSEVDHKFSKSADKEYDGVSSDVKKWFKKLAKEEKAHDERIAIANAKIKQAGLMYDKKSKKSARDASEEHARYINLISTMGPEISQEKYKHCLEVTQKHTTTTYNVAASVSRLADAEWLRSCESVRRFAPSIGRLSEWRTYCEGGWTGPVPADLKDIGVVRPSTPKRYDYEDDNEIRMVGKAEGMRLNDIPPYTDVPVPNSTLHETIQQIHPFPSPTLTQAYSHYQSRQNQNADQSVPPSSFDPPRKFTDSDNTGSVRSLSQFPAPPRHFPLPPPLAQRQSSGSSSAVNLASLDTSRIERQFERKSPGSDNASDNSPITSSHLLERPVSNEAFARSVERTESPKQYTHSEERTLATNDPPCDQVSLSPAQSTSHHPQSPKSRGDSSSDTRDEWNGSAQGGQEVTRAGSNGSIVAAMRNRYSNTSGNTSPPPKNIPRLPLSVTDLATRYQSPDSPSPRSRPLSPNGSRPVISLDTLRQGDVLKDQPSSSPSSTSRPNTSEPFRVDDERRHNQRRSTQLVELEIQGREGEIRLREREVELRSQELERENAVLFSRNEAMIAREPTELDSIKSAAHPTETSTVPFSGRPLSQYSSASTSNLAPPPSFSYGSNAGSTSARRDSSQNSSTSTSNHAPYCGCENCSASKYKASSPLASPIRSEKEKPKGWMRRLSMPIVAGNSFLDSKKHKDSGYGSGKGVRTLDSKKNGSTTGLRSSITEEGRLGAVSGRRSYDAGGISNRSMTNLGLNARQ